VSSIQSEVPKYSGVCFSYRRGLGLLRSDPCSDTTTVTVNTYAEQFFYRVKYRIKSSIELGGFPKEKKPEIYQRDICSHIQSCDLFSKETFLKEHNCDRIETTEKPVDPKKVNAGKREAAGNTKSQMPTPSPDKKVIPK
jgi:hypothetical protein